MTEPTPDPPHETPSADAPHGLVEEIRHEIEEAVEHVPQPVRWTVRKLVGLGFAILAGLIVLAIVSVVLYYANRTELAAKELTLFLNHTLATRSNVQIEVTDLRGNPFQRMRLMHPRVTFREGGGTLLEAPWIELGYSPLSLLRKDGRTVDIVVESPVIRIERGSDGALRLPTWKTSGKIGGKPSAIDVQFRMHNGTIVLPIHEPSVQGLDIDALLATGAQSRASIRTLRWRSGPYETRNLSLTGEIAAGDSVRFRISRLSTADVSLSATGAWKKGERTKLVHADVAKLEWQWLAKVTRNGAFDVPGQASAMVDARGDSNWVGTFASTLAWNGLDASGHGRFAWAGRRLRVEPLSARTSAGDLEGFATWSQPGYDVGGDVTQGKPELWKSIGIPGWPEGLLNGRFVYAVDTRQHVSNGTLRAVLTPSTLAGWHADSTAITADLPAHGTRTFDVEAARRGGHFTLHGATIEGGWSGTYQVAGLPLDEWPDGRASGIRGMLEQGAGTVTVVHGVMSVTGELAGRGTDWLGLHAAKWKMNAIDGVLLPKPDLRATGALADVMFLGVHFDSVASPVHLGDRNLDLIATTAQAGDTLLALGGRADWNGTSWQMQFDRASATSRQFHWIADPPVQLVGDGHGVTFRRFEMHDGEASASVTGHWAAPGGWYDWRGTVRRLDLSRIGLPPEWGLGGTADGILRVNGNSGDPRWVFDGSASHPSFGGHHGDSLDVSLGGAMAKVEVERLRFAIGSGELAAHGRMERTARAWPDSLTGTAVLRWLTSAASWSGGLDAKAFPIERVTGLFPATAGWAGRMDGSAGVAGSPARPQLDLKASVSPLTWHDFNLERIDAEARYTDEQLSITRLRASRLKLESYAEGQVPMRIAFDRPWQLLDKPMDVALHVRQGDLRLLPRLLPQIAAAAGSMEADGTIRGTPLSPNLEGRGQVTGASLRLSGRDEVLDHVQAWFHMSQTSVVVDSLVAHEGDEGRLRANGTVRLEGLVPTSYQLNLALRNFTASDAGLYAVQFDGDFLVTDGPRVHGQWLPFVTGKANVNRAVVLIDFANQSEEQQLAASNPPLFWLYRIDLQAKSNIHWQPPDGDIEFSADLTAEQDSTELRLYGSLQSIRGTYYFLSNRFNVDNATLTFDNVTGVNPTIDAQATTRIVPLGVATGGIQSSTAKEDQPHDVTVSITGRSREPQISFDSSPSDWDENEILRQLTLLRFVSRQGVAQSDPLDNYLTRAINRALSREMSSAFRGYLNDWELDREQGGLATGQGPVIVGVRSQVTRNLALGYRQRLPGLDREVITPVTGTTPFERDLQAEYRLNRFFLISSELTQRRTLTGTVTNSTSAPDFNVDLKARWEY